MFKLLQVAGFPCETTAIQLVEFLKKIFPNEQLQNVWLDPYREPRAVAMFLHELDEVKLYKLIQRQDVELHDHILAFKTAKPTWSIFVRTYGSVRYGAIDKVLLTFQKKPSRIVQDIQPLDEDCYEIIFSSGWDAVQEVCKKDWEVDKTKLTVCPYFECFKEPVVEIHERLSTAEVADQRLQNICKKSSAPIALTKSPLVTLPNKPNINLYENIDQETLSEATKDSDYRRPSEFNEKTTVYFKHQFIPILLKCLHFDKALDGYDCHLNIHEDGDCAELEFEITGPKMKVKRVARLLDQEYKKLKVCKTRNNFLALKKILPDLLKRINATKGVVVITEMGNDISLDVTDCDSNKVTFKDFVSSLALEEQFSPLSIEAHQDHSKVIEQFNKDYKFGHIFVSETNLTLMFLSHKKQKMNVFIQLMKSKLKSHSVIETEVNKNNCKEEDSITNDHQNLTEPSDSGNSSKQENLSAMKSYSEVEKITNEVYCFKYSFFLWLLHTLNLRSTVADICPTLTLKLDVLHLKVLISGQANEVHAVKQCLKEEDEMISLTEDEITFFEKKKIKSQLLPLINKHGISLVPDSKGPTQLKLVVKNDKGKIEQFHNFIKSLLVTKECCTLPSREVYESVAWQTFQESSNSQYNFCEIFVSNNLMVNLLALAHKSEELEMIIPLIIKNFSPNASNDDKIMTLLNPADSQDVNDEEMSQECVEDESSVIQDTAVKKTKDKKRGPTLTLICQNKFFVWLLDQLKFKEVVENMYPGTSVDIDEDEIEVVIRGGQAESIKSLVLEIDGQISYNEDEETFLQNVKILQKIETTIKSDSMNLVLSDNLECFVQYQDGHQVSLKNLASDFVVIKECLPLPSVRFQDILQWRDLVESLHSKHPFHQISVDGTKVMILTLKDRDEMETNEIENDLNQFILNNDEQSLRKNILLAVKNDSSCDKDQYDTTFYQNTGNSQQNEEYGKSHNKSQDSDFIEFLPFSQQQIQYCNMFLQQELQDIQETYKSTEITIQCDGIELKASSEHCGYELKARMKSLFDRIIKVIKELKYPGLRSFFKSEYGLKLMSQMSTKYECFIEPPMEGADKTNTGLEVLNPEDQRINYQVTLLGTAKCPGFTLHLVQGNMRDMKSDVKVEFCISSEAQECIFKTNKSSCDITINLPRWKAPENSEYQEHFNQLRNSLRSVVGIVLDQVKYLKKTTATFYTNAIHEKEFPFPLDVIAKIITEQLFAAFTDSSDSSVDVDVYICEPKYESVFKAFSYFMKRMGVDFGTPDQVSWDQICERDTSKHPDYRQYKCDVEIVARNPEYLATTNLFCYPIQPSLEASSCPVYFDPMSSKSLLEHSLKELLKEMPDGLLIGDVHPVSCFPFSRDALVYCIPEWGSGVYQALKTSLKNIFKQSYKYDAFIITPPGLGVQKFPLPYLIQTFFQLLDEIIAKENSLRKKKIYLVVHNTEDKMAFERELQKRCPKIAEKQHSWWSFSSFWDSSDKKALTGRASSSCTDSSILISKVVSLPIKYWGTSKEKINMAHCNIERELKRLMSDSTLTCRLDKKETGKFENLLKQMANISVLVTFKKQFTAQNQGQQSHHNTKSGKNNKVKNKNKHPKTDEIGSKMIMTGSELTFQGLNQRDVYDFRDTITSAIGKDPNLESSSSHLSEDIDWPSRGEDKFNTYDIDPANISMGPDTFQYSSSLIFQQNDGRHGDDLKEVDHKDKTHHYDIAISKNETDHNAGTSTLKITEENKGLISNETTCQSSASAAAHECIGSFKWLYQATEKTSSRKAFITFKHFYEATNQMIEAAYSEDKKTSADIKDGKVTHVDFSDMTVTLCGKKKGIIRVEELDSSLQETKPAVWTVKEDEVWKDIKLVEDSEPFQNIEKELKEKIPVKITNLNIKRIENINLFQRFKTKNSQLDGNCTFMWHKLSEDNVPLVCEFGFHPRFSTMRDENMGDGVLFKASPWDCLEEKEIKDKKTVVFLRSRLALGQTGPGVKRFRCVPQDTKGQPQDSVQVDGQAMIFSDAQAYPSHLITFTFV